MTALEVALAGHWGSWWGLDPGLDPADLTARYGQPRGGGSPAGGQFGEMVELPPPAPLTALRVWSRDGRVALVEVDDPAAPDGADAAVQALGQPALTQPARLTRYRYETTDHIYPARGTALVVAVAYDHGLPGPAPDRTPRLVHAELFVPTDLPGWQANWGRFGRIRPPLIL